MTRRRRVLLVIGAILVVGWVVVWVVGTVAGRVVDCGPNDQATCEVLAARAIREAPASAGFPYFFLPVTYVQVPDAPPCWSYTVRFGWVLSYGVAYLC